MRETRHYGTNQNGGARSVSIVECPFCGAEKGRDYDVYPSHLEAEHGPEVLEDA